MPQTSRPAPNPERAQRARPVRKQRRKYRRILNVALKVLGTIVLVGLITGLLLSCFAAVYIRNTIVPESKRWVADYGDGGSVSLTSTMYYTDENGVDQPYLTIDSEKNRIWVKYEDLEKTDIINALIAIEDKRFYQHKGVDWLRTGKGVLNMFTGGSIQGGSTLTQQFIKNTTGENDVTVKRKIGEIFRALEFEKRHTKSQILELYLNEIYLGERCYGVGSASWAYFGKDVTELSLAQCASLVGITNNPSRYDPYLNKNLENPQYSNDAANRKRAKLVLWNMLDQHMIDEATYTDACDEVDRMEFVRGSPEGGGPVTIYNWYQDQVIDDVMTDLMEKYDWSAQVASNKIFYGGLKIYTNVDVRVQEIVDEVYSDRDSLSFMDRVSNSGQPLQSSIVILDDRGRVVALSGGIGEKTKNRAWSRASDTKRPSGSSIKPLSVYAPAIEMGLITPNSVVDDVPYQILGGSAWPSNAVHYYKGFDTISHAVEQSTNTVAVRVLGDYVTPQRSYDFLENTFHISSLVLEKWINNKKYTDMGLAPLALGGLTNGVSVYEMAAAYATFPSMGRYVTPRTYSRVLDADGNVLLDRTGDGEYVLKESTAFYMNNLLSGVVANGTGKDAAFSGMTIAGKTGTTTSQKDLWFVGYTPYYTAAVWVGYDRQERLGDIGHPQNLIWKEVMSRVHKGLENRSFPKPSGAQVITASYCLDSGMIPSELCALDARGSRVATGAFLEGDAPTAVCSLHTEIQVCTADLVTDPESGEPLGRFRLAGDFCPEDTVQTVSVLDYTREGVAALCTPRDSWGLLSAYEEEGTCLAHTAENTDPMLFDPEDPSTWPNHDPNFDPGDPSTWPQPHPQPGDPVWPADEPGTDPWDPVRPGQSTPAPTEPPAHPWDEPDVTHPPENDTPPANEPYVPAGNPAGIPDS